MISNIWQVKNLFLLLIVLIIQLAGCSTTSLKPPVTATEATPVVITEYVEIPAIPYPELPRPDALVLLPVSFVVVTGVDDFEVNFGDSEAMLLLSIQDYENLGLNMQEILSYIRKMNSLVAAYEDF